MRKTDFPLLVKNHLDIYEDDAREIVYKMFDIMGDMLVEGKIVHIPNFGTFEKRWHKGGKIRHVLTGELMIASDYWVILFRPSERVKKALNDDSN